MAWNPRRLIGGRKDGQATTKRLEMVTGLNRESGKPFVILAVGMERLQMSPDEARRLAGIIFTSAATAEMEAAICQAVKPLRTQPDLILGWDDSALLQRIQDVKKAVEPVVM